jgi:hypothetical protein
LISQSRGLGDVYKRQDFPKYGAATYSNGKFTIEIGKPSFTELGENEESYFEVLKSN